MSDDDRWEMQISATLDGESSQAEMLEVLDVVARSPRHREFYRRARELQEFVATLPPALDRAEARRQLPASVLRPRRWRRAAVAVAAVVAAVAFVLPFGSTPEDPAPQVGTLSVVLAEDAGAMTDERFLQLTLELLRADRHYQRLMRGVLEEVGTGTVLVEGSTPMAYRAHDESRREELDRLQHRARDRSLRHVY